MEDLAGRIDGVVDGGPAEVGLESTVVMVEDDRIRVLRPGGVTREALAEAAGCEVVAEGAASDEGEGVRRSARRGEPRGCGAAFARHEVRALRARGEMTLVIGNGEAVRAYIGREAAAARAAGCRTGVLTYEEHAGFYDADAVVVCGSLARPEQAAQRLYAALREFDARGIGRIWAEGCPPEGIGLALMNRLASQSGRRADRPGVTPVGHESRLVRIGIRRETCAEGVGFMSVGALRRPVSCSRC